MERGVAVNSTGLSHSLDAFYNGVTGVTDILAIASSGLCVAASSRSRRTKLTTLPQIFQC